MCYLSCDFFADCCDYAILKQTVLFTFEFWSLQVAPYEKLLLPLPESASHLRLTCAARDPLDQNVGVVFLENQLATNGNKIYCAEQTIGGGPVRTLDELMQ